MYTELEAVNYVLSQVGIAPVTTLDSELPDINTARQRLRESSIWIQKRGWWFNKLLGVELEPDESDGTITLPTDTFKVLASYPDFLIEMGGQLFDMRKQSYEFGSTVSVDIVVFLEWDSLPSSVQDCIIYRAGQQHILHELEDHNKAMLLQQDYELAFIELQKEELQIKQRNSASTPSVQRTYRRVRPYKRRSTTVDPRVPGGMS